MSEGVEWMWTIPEYLERISFYFRYFEIYSYVVLFLFCIDNVARV